MVVAFQGKKNMIHLYHASPISLVQICISDRSYTFGEVHTRENPKTKVLLV
jgi:hypothetical protein